MNRIREVRRQRGLTLEKLGEAIGLSSNTISRYETGAREPKLKNWIRMVQALNVDVGYLQGTSPTYDTYHEQIDWYLDSSLKGMDFSPTPQAVDARPVISLDSDKYQFYWDDRPIQKSDLELIRNLLDRLYGHGYKASH